MCQKATRIFISGLGALKRATAQQNLQHAAFHCPGALFNRLTLWSGRKLPERVSTQALSLPWIAPADSIMNSRPVTSAASAGVSDRRQLPALVQPRRSSNQPALGHQ